MSILLALLALLAPFGQQQTGSRQSNHGELRVQVIGIGTVRITVGREIYIDPQGANYFAGLPKADLILITANEDPAAVAAASKATTTLIHPGQIQTGQSDTRTLHALGASITRLTVEPVAPQGRPHLQVHN